MPGAFDTCCTYFCTGLSVFGTAGLVLMGYILNSGNNWFLGVSDEGASAAATACYLSAGIYLLYLIFCGMKVMSWNSKASDAQELLDSEAV